MSLFNLNQRITNIQYELNQIRPPPGENYAVLQANNTFTGDLNTLKAIKPTEIIDVLNSAGLAGQFLISTGSGLTWATGSGGAVTVTPASTQTGAIVFADVSGNLYDISGWQFSSGINGYNLTASFNDNRNGHYSNKVSGDTITLDRSISGNLVQSSILSAGGLNLTPFDSSGNPLPISTLTRNALTIRDDTNNSVELASDTLNFKNSINNTISFFSTQALKVPSIIDVSGNAGSNQYLGTDSAGNILWGTPSNIIPVGTIESGTGVFSDASGIGWSANNFIYTPYSSGYQLDITEETKSSEDDINIHGSQITLTSTNRVSSAVSSTSITPLSIQTPTILDASGASGSANQVLSSTGTGLQWITPGSSTIPVGTNQTGTSVFADSSGNAYSAPNWSFNQPDSVNYTLDIANVGTPSTHTTLNSSGLVNHSTGYIGYIGSQTLQFDNITNDNQVSLTATNFTIKNQNTYNQVVVNSSGVAITDPSQNTLTLTGDSIVPSSTTAAVGTSINPINQLYSTTITGNSIIPSTITSSLGASGNRWNELYTSDIRSTTITDRNSSKGTTGQVLSSTGTGLQWQSLPNAAVQNTTGTQVGNFTFADSSGVVWKNPNWFITNSVGDNFSYELYLGDPNQYARGYSKFDNTGMTIYGVGKQLYFSFNANDILWGGVRLLDNTTLYLQYIQDGLSSTGTAGQVLSATGTGLQWITPSGGSTTIPVATSEFGTSVFADSSGNPYSAPNIVVTKNSLNGYKFEISDATNNQNYSTLDYQGLHTYQNGIDNIASYLSTGIELTNNLNQSISSLVPEQLQLSSNTDVNQVTINSSSVFVQNNALNTLTITGNSIVPGSTNTASIGSSSNRLSEIYTTDINPTTITDGFSSVGGSGQVLSSTSTGLEWITPVSAPVDPVAGELGSVVFNSGGVLYNTPHWNFAPNGTLPNQYDLTCQGNFIPSADNVYSLGTPTNRFKDLHVAGATIYIGDASISATGTAVSLPTGTTVGSGTVAADNSASPSSIAIGLDAGAYGGGIQNAFIGYQAGQTNGGGQNVTCIGYQAGQQAPQGLSTSIGSQAGQQGAGLYSTNIGGNAGSQYPANYSTNIGYRAGEVGAGQFSVNIGLEAGTNNSVSQTQNCIAIGRSAGNSNQGAGYPASGYCIAIGNNAGKSQAPLSVCIGNNAQTSAQGSIVLYSPTNPALPFTATTAGFFANPVRINPSTGSDTIYSVSYDSNTCEIIATNPLPALPSGGIPGQVLVSAGGSTAIWSPQILTYPPINVPATGQTYGTSQPPSVPNAYQYNSDIYDGWYYSNYRTGINIGWNMPLSRNLFTNYTGFDSSGIQANWLQQAYVCFTSTTTTSAVNLTFYTQQDTTGGFYKSKFSAIYNQPILANIPYIAYYNFTGSTLSPPQKLLHTPLAMSKSPVGIIGNFYGETCRQFSVSTSSTASAGSDAVIVSEAGVIINDGINPPYRQPFQFLGASVQPLNPSSVTSVVTSIALAPIIGQNGYTFLPVIPAVTLGGLVSGANIVAGYTISFLNYTAYGSPASIAISYNGSSTYTITSNQAVTFSWTGNLSTGGTWALV